MSIQSNINQGLAIGAALLSQTPRAAEVKEKRAAMKEKKTLTTAKKDLKTAYSSNGTKLAIGRDPKEREVYLEKTADIENRLGDINIKLGEGEEAAGHYAILGQTRRAIANQKAKEIATDKASQKQEMNAYIKGVSSDYMKLLKEENNGNNKTSN